MTTTYVADSTPAEVTSFTLDSTVINLDEGDVLQGSLGFRDDISGFSYGSANFYSPESGYNVSLNFSNNEYDNLDIAYGREELNEYTPRGTYELESIYISDKAGNYTSKSYSDYGWESFLEESGITDTSVEVIRNGDNAPPNFDPGTSDLETKEAIFDFDYHTKFSDLDLAPEASFSNGSETGTWLYGENTARLSAESLPEVDVTDSSIVYSNKGKYLGEGEIFLVKNDDGSIWGIQITDSQSRVHGGNVDGVVVTYALLTEAPEVNQAPSAPEAEISLSGYVYGSNSSTPPGAYRNHGIIKSTEGKFFIAPNFIIFWTFSPRFEDIETFQCSSDSFPH